MILLGSQSNSSVVIGQTGLVHIWGQNNTTVRQRMAISWVVKDPDGLLVESYTSGWSIMIDPGDDHEFIGDRRELFKEGTYTIEVGLFMNPENPTMVDSWSGSLCTVVAEVPPLPPTCVIDADCPEGYVCKDGICVPKEEEKFPWLPVILIGGGVVVGSYLLVKRKK